MNAELTTFIPGNISCPALERQLSMHLLLRAMPANAADDRVDIRWAFQRQQEQRHREIGADGGGGYCGAAIEYRLAASVLSAYFLPSFMTARRYSFLRSTRDLPDRRRSIEYGGISGGNLAGCPE